MARRPYPYVSRRTTGRRAGLRARSSAWMKARLPSSREIRGLARTTRSGTIGRRAKNHPKRRRRRLARAYSRRLIGAERPRPGRASRRQVWPPVPRPTRPGAAWVPTTDGGREPVLRSADHVGRATAARQRPELEQRAAGRPDRSAAHRACLARRAGGGDGHQPERGDGPSAGCWPPSGWWRATSNAMASGRPRHRYDLTAAAQTLLPSNYASLATDLLDALLVVADEAVVDAVFAERRRRQAALIRGRFADRRLDDATLQERVRELAVIQDEQGYLCECCRYGGGHPDAAGQLRDLRRRHAASAGVRLRARALSRGARCRCRQGGAHRERGSDVHLPHRAPRPGGSA